ncbi:hypothetical protein D1872_261380 [compost metagenome]
MQGQGGAGFDTLERRSDGERTWKRFVQRLDGYFQYRFIVLIGSMDRRLSGCERMDDAVAVDCGDFGIVACVGHAVVQQLGMAVCVCDFEFQRQCIADLHLECRLECDSLDCITAIGVVVFHTFGTLCGQAQCAWVCRRLCGGACRKRRAVGAVASTQGEQ